MASLPGVGFRVAWGNEVYFWTTEGDEILGALKRLGAPVVTEVHRVPLFP